MMNEFFSSLATKIRTKVSADRRRYVDTDYDLDLTYITDRVIAMGFPAEGVEGLFRNRLDAVAQFLNERHGGHYLVVNLSGRSYSYGKLDNQVVDFGFPDHHSPPLPLLLQICNSMNAWLQADEQNVVAVHCLGAVKPLSDAPEYHNRSGCDADDLRSVISFLFSQAGKGRTGTVIACYMILCGLFDTARDALRHFARMRSSQEKGVAIPSQVRYVQYFASLIHRIRRGDPFLKPKKMMLRKIILHTVPHFRDSLLGCRPYLQVYKAPSQHEEGHLLFSSSWQDWSLHSYHANDPLIEFPVDTIVEGRVCAFIRRSLPYVQYFHLLHFDAQQKVPSKTILLFRAMCVSAVMKPILGDILIRCYHVRATTLSSKVLVFRTAFNMSFLKEGSFSLTRLELDEAADEKKHPPHRFSPDFRVEFTLENVPADAKVGYIHAEAPGTASKRPEKMGYMRKQGAINKAWKRRWFVLKPFGLQYYRSTGDANPAGVIPLQETTVVVPATTPTNPYLFKVVNPERTFVLEALSEDDMKDWINALLHTCAMPPLFANDAESSAAREKQGPHGPTPRNVTSQRLHPPPCPAGVAQREHESRDSWRNLDQVAPIARLSSEDHDLEEDALDNVPVSSMMTMAVDNPLAAMASAGEVDPFAAAMGPQAVQAPTVHLAANDATLSKNQHTVAIAKDNMSSSSTRVGARSDDVSALDSSDVRAEAVPCADQPTAVEPHAQPTSMHPAVQATTSAHGDSGRFREETSIERSSEDQEGAGEDISYSRVGAGAGTEPNGGSPPSSSAAAAACELEERCSLREIVVPPAAQAAAAAVRAARHHGIADNNLVPHAEEGVGPGAAPSASDLAEQRPSGVRSARGKSVAVRPVTEAFLSEAMQAFEQLEESG